MNLNRFSLLCAATFALSAPSTFAQDTKPGKPETPGQGGKLGQRRGGMNPKALEKALELTPEQVEKLKPSFKKLTDGRKALAEETTEPKAKREKMMALTKELMKSVEAVLTPEQKKKFEELRTKMEAGAKKKKKDGGN